MVGGSSWPQLLDILRPGGKYITSGAIAGPIVDLDLRSLYLKDLTLFGSTVNDPYVFENVIRCVDCGNLKLVDKICICSSDNSYDKICVVENLADMWAIESSNIFKGYFHILGGTLNNNDNNGQKNLLIDSLLKRIEKNKRNMGRY